MPASPATVRPTVAFDVDRVREDFPALHQRVNGAPLAYLDNAATSQKPRAVIDRMAAYYASENSNVHRGVHTLSQRATDAYEAGRELVQGFINARHAHEIIFTRGTTESINLVAATFGRSRVRAGDNIVVSTLEHHSNIVPWQFVCEEKGATLRVVPVSDAGVLDLGAYERLLDERTRIVAISHISNALGTINPVRALIAAAHRRGIPVLLDSAQAAPHAELDVQALDVDFCAFSGHKMMGPTGIGVLYGKEALLDAMPPYQGGGDMIESVSFAKTTYNTLPHKFEAGTPHIAGVIGLGAAIAYLEAIGMDAIAAYEQELLDYATERLADIDGIRFIGTAPEKAAVVSFLIGNIHPYDTGSVLDRLGIAVRTGHHCTQPLMERLGIPGTARASFAFYNTREEIDRLHAGLLKVRTLFG
ncbi:MAG: cysteine desulfurase [Rhodothermales bacterium]|nr:cysteine desulfurase [Rhodothermales bacterium]